MHLRIIMRCLRKSIFSKTFLLLINFINEGHGITYYAIICYYLFGYLSYILVKKKRLRFNNNIIRVINNIDIELVVIFLLRSVSISVMISREKIF